MQGWQYGKELIYLRPLFCVVQESIHISPMEGNENSEGRGVGSKGDNFRGGWALLPKVFPGGPSKIGELLMNNNFSVE